MTPLHRAGLAGLYMSLSGLESQHGRPAGLQWTLSDNAVEIAFSQPSDLQWLCTQSFGIDHDGLLNLAGLRGALVRRGARFVAHDGFLLTFAQHGRTRGAGKPQTLAF